jgi:hypothetical protein
MYEPPGHKERYAKICILIVVPGFSLSTVTMLDKPGWHSAIKKFSYYENSVIFAPFTLDNYSP